MLRITFTDAEHATLLAALRCWQGKLAKDEPNVVILVDIATNGGTLPCLDEDEIEDLCEKVNCDFEVA